MNIKIAENIKAFGCTEEQMREEFERKLNSRRRNCAAMMAMSLLGDAQDELTWGDVKDARHAINRAQWIISEYLTSDRVPT
jgi:hypothetical protein